MTQSEFLRWLRGLQSRSGLNLSQVDYNLYAKQAEGLSEDDRAAYQARLAEQLTPPVQQAALPPAQATQPALKERTAQAGVDMATQQGYDPRTSKALKATKPVPDSDERNAVNIPGWAQEQSRDQRVNETAYGPEAPPPPEPPSAQKLPDEASQYTRDAWGRIVPLTMAGLGQINNLGGQAPTSDLIRQRELELAGRSAEQRAEADRAGAIAARDEMVQAGRDVSFAQDKAASAAKRNLGIAGAGAAAQAGAEAAFDAGTAAQAGAVRDARARKDLFEQKEVDRRQRADDTRATLNDLQQIRTDKDIANDQANEMNSSANYAQNSAQIAKQQEAYRKLLERRRRQQEENEKNKELVKQPGDENLKDTEEEFRYTDPNASKPKAGEEKKETPKTADNKLAKDGSPMATGAEMASIIQQIGRSNPTVRQVREALQEMNLDRGIFEKIFGASNEQIDNTPMDYGKINEAFGYAGMKKVLKFVQSHTKNPFGGGMDSFDGQTLPRNDAGADKRLNPDTSKAANQNKGTVPEFDGAPLRGK